MTDQQVAEEIAVAVAEALARSQWSDGPARAQHARQAVLETLDRCKVRLAPLVPGQVFDARRLRGVVGG